MSDLVARALAHANEDEQAAFLNAFAQELRDVCRQGHGWTQQSWYFARALHPTCVEVLKQIVSDAEYHQSEARLNHQKLHDVREELRRAQKELEERRSELHDAQGMP